MKLYFLHHSGFMIDDGHRCYIFDFYKDPKGHVQAMAEQGRELWFFVTHVHGDHYNPAIAQVISNGAANRYIVHEDVPLTQSMTAPANEVIPMRVGSTITVDDVTITMYGSTDEGGSFLVDTGRNRIFHAGDLNWWHWSGDTPENIEEARQLMLKEFAPLTGLSVDIAMFPVDARLEEAREWGVWEFLHRVCVKELLVPMHYFGSVWQPSSYFKARYGSIPLWIPQQDGEAFSCGE